MKGSAVTYLPWFLGGYGVLGLHRSQVPRRWVTGLIRPVSGSLLRLGAGFDLFAIATATQTPPGTLSGATL